MVKSARRRGASDVAALSSARRRAILRERAERLARRAEGVGAAVRPVRVLLCEVGPDLYGLPMDQVAKVKPLERLGAAAIGHRAMLGLSADEGRIRPVLDLATLLGAPGAPVAPEGWLVLLSPPLKPALRLDRLPTAADVEPLQGDAGRAGVLSGEQSDKVLVMLSAGELLALVQPPSHGAATL